MFTWLLYAATEYVEWVPNSALNQLAKQNDATSGVFGAHLADVLRGTECAVAGFFFFVTLAWLLSNAVRVGTRGT